MSQGVSRLASSLLGKCNLRNAHKDVNEKNENIGLGSRKPFIFNTLRGRDARPLVLHLRNAVFFPKLKV